MLTKRPPITEVEDPPEFHARVARVVLEREAVARYSAVCGFDAAGGVPHTYPHVLATPLHLKIFATDAFPLRPMGLIHLSNVIEVMGELRAGMPLDLEVAARHFRKTDAGIAFDIDSQLSEAGQPLWRETCVFLSRWPDSVAHAASRPPRPPKAPKDARVLNEFAVTLGTAWEYARVSRDFNPIHLNDRVARFLGLRGAISHGMWSLARSLSESPQTLRSTGPRLEAQFLTPVQLPGKVNIKEWTEAGQLRRAMCDVRTGRVHMYATWTPAAGGSAGASA